ncbi:hypothetical protein SVAN01_04627 [Stagonosporopsis vannaccii]|nr:hypothetical protein SVAN01_04627 [Stagonosporopsis vannaccii]
MQPLATITGLLALLLFAAHSVTAHLPSQNQQSPYKYTFKELKPQHGAYGSFPQPYFRFNIFLRKNSGVTEEYFHRHWKTVHADLTMSEADAGVRLLRYTQFHQDDSHRQIIQPLLNATGGLLAIAPYDGIAEFQTKDYDTFEKFIMQIFHNPVLVVDQQSFVDSGAAMDVMAGYDNLIFSSAGGAARGKTGIQPGDRRLVYSRPRV